MKRDNRVNEDENTYNVTSQYTSYQPHTNDAVNDHDISTQPIAPPPKKRFRWKLLVVILLLICIGIVVIFGIWNYRNASDASEKLFGSGNLVRALPPNELKNTNGRTNILLIGDSSDDPGHAGAALTDSIMIASMDKDSKTGFLISIPRDLYVDIPDYGSAKINEAVQAGDRNEFNEAGYHSGGIGLLEKIIADDFGVRIDHHIVINYGAVREITDALGGIAVTIESPDPRGLYDPNFKPNEGGPLSLTNGPQTIDGQTALRLTRARGSTAGSYGFPQSDFNRVQNQQKVFAAIKSQLSFGLLIDPRTNKPILDAVANNVTTDLEIDNVLPLLQLFRSVPNNNLKQINLRDVDKKNYLASYTTPRGQSALIPAAGVRDYSEIQALIAELSN